MLQNECYRLAQVETVGSLLGSKHRLLVNECEREKKENIL